MQPYLAREWHKHEQLFVSARNELGRGVKALRPCFLADGPAAVRLVFVQGAQRAEVNLRVKDVLERRRDVIAVIVFAMTVVVVVRVRFVVTVGHLEW